MSDKKHWITNIVPALAFAAGIIIASVGGIMVTSSSLKLAFFDSEPYSYITEDQCRHRSLPESSMKTLSGEGSGLPGEVVDDHQQSLDDIETCMHNLKEQEEKRFKKGQQENIIDGISALIVGGVLLLAFRRRK